MTRRPRKTRVLLGLLGLLLPSVFFMADATTSSADWTLDAALAQAEEGAPGVQRATAELAVATAHTAFGRRPVVGNPVLAARALFGPDSSAATYSLSFGVPLDFSGSRSAWQSEASHMVEGATAMVDIARADSRRDAFTAYVDVSAAQNVLANSRDRADAARVFVASVEARLRAGAATSLDVVLAQRELALAQAAVEESERELENAKEAFRQALDLGALESVEIEELIRPEIPEGLTINAATTRALRGRRETAAWRAQQARFRAAEQRVRRDAIEPVTVALEGERQGNRSAAYGAGASLSVPLPIVRTAQADRAVMRSQAELADHELALAQRD
ncbi:MAG: TolC family protein [Sandaracinaceae bacterium]|nr:TolC family protein [Sandaracinaceae bacterium]